MLKAMTFLISLTILTSSCTHINSGAQFNIPERPQLPKAEWKLVDNMFCTDETGARNMLKREAIRDGYESQLKSIIHNANKALSK